MHVTNQVHVHEIETLIISFFHYHVYCDMSAITSASRCICVSHLPLQFGSRILGVCGDHLRIMHSDYNKN